MAFPEASTNYEAIEAHVYNDGSTDQVIARGEVRSNADLTGAPEALWIAWPATEEDKTAARRAAGLPY